MAHRSSTQGQYVALATSMTGCSPSKTEHLSPRCLADQQPPSSDHSHGALAGARSATRSDSTEETSTPLAGFRTEKDVATQESTEIVRQRIHWLSPTLMLGSLLAGALLALGHHFYYRSLHGQTVGNSQRQQWALRLGNLFAFLVKSCLANSAGIAYIQWLWKTLRCKYMTIGGIDAAFAVRIQGRHFDSVGFVVGYSLMAYGNLITCIPFVALVTPATLSVEASSQRITTSQNIATLDISNYLPLDPNDSDDKAWQFVDRFVEVSVNGDPLSDSTPYVVSGTSNRLARLVAASASSGEILPITNPLPGFNVTYRLKPYLPALKCETSSKVVALNTTIAAVVSAGLETNNQKPFNFSELDMRQLTYGFGGQISKTYIGYFAMVPQHTRSGMPRPMESLDTEKMVTSQLWVVMADHAQDGSTIPRFFTCQLWNASLSLNISYLNDVQTLQHDKLTYINEIDPTSIIREHQNPRNMASMSCEGFFWEVCQQLIGLIGFSEFKLINNANIRDTSLTSASEFDGLFNIFTAMEHGVIPNNKSMAEMAHGLTLDDKNISQIGTSPLNKSLGVLIEEFALNASLNLLSDSVLSTPTSAEVTHSIIQNIYKYEPYNLILAYGLAIFFTLLIMVLGGLAYRSNGVSYEHTISSIIGTTQTADLARLFRRQTGGGQPLDPQIAKTKLRFGIVTPLDDDKGPGQRDQRLAFGIEGTVTTIEGS